jgi:hypothetical protein
MGPSGMKVNNRDVMELQVMLTSGKKLGLLSQRTDDELAWMASLLRIGIRVPSD